MGIHSARYTKQSEAITGSDSSISIQHPAKRVMLYVLLFAAICLMLNYIIIRTEPEDSIPYTERLVFIILYLATGAVHIFVFPKWLPHLHNKDLKTGVMYTLLLALISAAGAYLLFSFNGFHMPLLAVATGCAFLLPAAFQQLWNYFDFFHHPPLHHGCCQLRHHLKKRLLFF